MVLSPAPWAQAAFQPHAVNERPPGEDRDLDDPQGFSPSLGWGLWHGRKWWSGLGSVQCFSPFPGGPAQGTKLSCEIRTGAHCCPQSHWVQDLLRVPTTVGSGPQNCS